MMGRMIRGGVSATKAERRALFLENQRWPVIMTAVPRSDWPPNPPVKTLPVQVWRSRYFLAQIFAPSQGATRISVNRTSISGSSWSEHITWEDLQRIKSECGFANEMAVEIFPSDSDVVNVANMRHLWVLDAPLPFAWGTRG